MLIAFLITTSLFAQNWNELKNIYGQKYFDSKGDFFVFLPDSIVATSLNSYGDTAIFKINKDTLFTMQEFAIMDKKGYRKEIATNYFVISQITYNSILIKAHGSYKKNYNQHLSKKKFFNEKTLREDITKFELFQIETNGPWHGYKKTQIYANGTFTIIIDSTRSMSKIMERNETIPITGTYNITSNELDTFLKLLRNSQITKVQKASSAIIDKTQVDLFYRRNNRSYNLYDISIGNAQTALINYIEELEKKYFYN